MKRLKILSVLSALALSSIGLYAGDESFWNEVAAIKNQYEPAKPLFVGEKFVHESSQGMQKVLFSHCNLFAPIARECLSAGGHENVLFLGCGEGANVLPFVMNGTKVIAYEQELLLLKKLQKSVPKAFAKNVLLRRGDISSAKPFLKEGEAISTVVCVDVIPYLSFDKLQETMKKIWTALPEGGSFYGTLFIKPKKAHPEYLGVMEMLGKLGASYFSSQEQAQEMLEKSGFEVKNFSVCKDSPSSFQFIAEKIGE